MKHMYAEERSEKQTDTYTERQTTETESVQKSSLNLVNI